MDKNLSNIFDFNDVSLLIDGNKIDQFQNGSQIEISIDPEEEVEVLPNLGKGMVVNKKSQTRTISFTLAYGSDDAKMLNSIYITSKENNSGVAKVSVDYSDSFRKFIFTEGFMQKSGKSMNVSEGVEGITYSIIVAEDNVTSNIIK